MYVFLIHLSPSGVLLADPRNCGDLEAKLTTTIIPAVSWVLLYLLGHTYYSSALYYPVIQWVEITFPVVVFVASICSLTDALKAVRPVYMYKQTPTTFWTSFVSFYLAIIMPLALWYVALQLNYPSVTQWGCSSTWSISNQFSSQNQFCKARAKPERHSLRKIVLSTSKNLVHFVCVLFLAVRICFKTLHKDMRNSRYK